MDITLNSIEFRQILTSVFDYANNRVLEMQCKLKPVISLQEAYKMASRQTVTKAIKANELKVIKKGGRTSKRWISRTDFDKWLLFTKITK